MTYKSCCILFYFHFFLFIAPEHRQRARLWGFCIFCRLIVRYSPSRLVMVDLSEFALYAIEQEFSDHFPGIVVSPQIGDAKSEPRMRDLFERYRPDLVFHAAAFKHVPLMEGGNAFQAVANNVLSTVVTARAAQAAGTAKPGPSRVLTVT